MMSHARLTAPGVVLLLILASAACGQTTETRGEFSIGANAGLFLPQGEWVEHPFAPGVDQFQKGVAIEGILEVEVMHWLGFALNFEYANLSTDDWENYAASKGSDVSASAYLVNFGGMFRPYLVNTPHGILKLDIGLNLVFPRGRETYGYISYDYDFLKTQVGLVTGIEYDLFVKYNLALSLRLGGVFVDQGVKYAGGEEHVLIGMPVMFGIRYYP